MKIGILSATHNNLPITRKVVEIFKNSKIDLLIHTGDLTSPAMLKEFEGLECKFVLGKADIEIENLNIESMKLGFGRIDESCSFCIDEKDFFVFHGSDVGTFRDMIRSGKYDYIIKGHPYSYEDYTSNSSRVINPGALYNPDEMSVAILNTSSDKVERIKISEED